jgi:hypothetical protein
MHSKSRCTGLIFIVMELSYEAKRRVGACILLADRVTQERVRVQGFRPHVSPLPCASQTADTQPYPALISLRSTFAKRRGTPQKQGRPGPTRRNRQAERLSQPERTNAACAGGLNTIRDSRIVSHDGFRDTPRSHSASEVRSRCVSAATASVAGAE